MVLILPALEVLGRTEAELQGSGAGAWFVAQGSLLFMGGTEGLVPHGSAGIDALGAEPSGWREATLRQGVMKTTALKNEFLKDKRKNKQQYKG